MSKEMYDDGYSNLKNLDFSEVVIAQMSQYEPQMIWEVMDVTDLKYANGSFDAVVAKGTLDAVLCSGLGDQKRMMEEIYRVLSDKGMLIAVSFGLPEKRRQMFDEPNLRWHTKVHTVPKPSIEKNYFSKEPKNSFHHIYVCQKFGGVDDEDVVRK
mmetsp:Transcript_6304/g.13639  ORF Transcript_6304/g.13639 Transcript_6304/m.13639 type:complete len:155 (-) Transcript_6304:379-843(-)